MYNDSLQAVTIPIDQLFLDPNNPRFSVERSAAPVRPSKVADAAVQDKTFNIIMNHGVDDLRNSILRNGFLPLDRIVVQHVQGVQDAYVAVEGNRRLAALRLLRSQIESGLIGEDEFADDYLDTLLKRTAEIEVLVYSGTESDIAWMLQGIRHISGIRDWDAAQRAKLISVLVEDKGMKFAAVGQTLGLSAKAVGRYYRGYCGLRQMESDPDFEDKARNEYFTLFDEAYKTKALRTWLGWSESGQVYENADNFKLFCEWISPSDDEGEHNGRRRIHDPTMLKPLAVLVGAGRADLIDAVATFTLDIDQAASRAKEGGSAESEDWGEKLSQAERIIASIPAAALPNFCGRLESLHVLLGRLVGFSRGE
jgi:hypothetical protein